MADLNNTSDQARVASVIPSHELRRQRRRFVAWSARFKSTGIVRNLPLRDGFISVAEMPPTAGKNVHSGEFVHLY
jgi:hypothetical protein